MVSYTRQQRKDAKDQGKGLFTISWTDPDGATVTISGVACKKVLEHTQKSLQEVIGMK